MVRLFWPIVKCRDKLRVDDLGYVPTAPLMRIGMSAQWIALT